MTRKKIHTKTKLFLEKPYITRVEYPEDTHDVSETKYRRLVRSIYKNVKFTWAHTDLAMETVRVKEEFPHATPPGTPGHFNGLNQNQIIQSLFTSDYRYVMRGYFAFVDELDAMQFRLTLDCPAIHVFMWPENLLWTIHEYFESDEPRLEPGEEI